MMKAASYHAPLDGLRGLAVLMVMLCHQTVMLPSTPFQNLWVNAFRTGWAGVDLFFVLSGFLITTILVNEKESPHYYRNFFMRRILRIMPVYYLTLFAFLFVFPRLPGTISASLEPVTDSPIYFLGFLTNFLIAQKGHWIQAPLSPLWSVAIEEQFYLIWPFVVAGLSTKRLKQLSLGIVLGVGACRVGLHLLNVNPYALYVLPFTRADTIGLGAFLALWFRESPLKVEQLSRKTTWLTLLLGGMGLGISAIPGRDSFLMSLVGFPLVGAFGFLLVTHGITSTKSVWKALLEIPFLKFVGKYSYGCYLFHIPALGACVVFGFKVEHFSAWPGGVWVAQGCLYSVSTAATILAAFVSYHLYEKRFLKLKTFFTATPAFVSQKQIQKAG